MSRIKIKKLSLRKKYNYRFVPTAKTRYYTVSVISDRVKVGDFCAVDNGEIHPAFRQLKIL